jgi:hypothetical protein
MGLEYPQNYTTTVTADGNTNTAVATTASTVSWQGETVTLGQTPASSLHAVYSSGGNQKYLLSHGRLNMNTRSPSGGWCDHVQGGHLRYLRTR